MSLKLSKKEHKFSNSWTLWFHNVNDNSWSDDSYKKVVGNIDNIEKFILMIKNINQVTSGMFFLMKDDIFPKYEDKHNIGGGYWSFKIGKKHSNEVWFNLISAMVGNTLTKDVNDMKTINGITISPKIRNCIFKIWNSDKSISSNKILTTSIPNIIPSEAQYKNHVENIQRDKNQKL